MGAFLGQTIGMMFNVNQLMSSVVRFMYWGTMPACAAAGGALATVAGVRTTLIVGAAGSAIALVPLALSPLRHLRELPEAADA